MKMQFKYLSVIILLSLIIFLLDKLNVNTIDDSVKHIQKQITEIENNIDHHAKQCRDLLMVKTKDKKTINALSDWGITDINDIFHKQFIINNTGWYLMFHKNSQYYVFKFKYLYPVNNQYLSEHYSECLNISKDFKLIYSEKARFIKTSSSFIPLEIIQYPKYKSKWLVNINALLIILWFLLLYHFLISINPSAWRWHLVSLIIIFTLRWLLEPSYFLQLIKDAWLYDIHFYAFPSLPLVQYFADVIITIFTFLIYFYYTYRLQSKKILLFNIIINALLLLACTHVLSNYSGFTLIISDALFDNYQNRLYTIFTLILIFILILHLAYLINHTFKKYSFYHFGISAILILAAVSFLIFQYHKKTLNKKTEFIFSWMEDEASLSLFEHCQLINKKLKDLNTLQDSIYFSKISDIENTSIHLQLSKRFLFEDSVSLNNFLNRKKNIQNNIFIGYESGLNTSQNEVSEYIYYINPFGQKYLVSVFEYISPFGNKILYSFLNDKIFQLPSGFKNFHVALYTQQRLKFKLGQLPFSSEFIHLPALQKLYPDLAFHLKSENSQSIVIAHKNYTFKDFISLFSAYFILLLTLFLAVSYFYFVLKYRHFFPLKYLSFSDKIIALVIFTSIISFYLFFIFSYQYIEKTLDNEIKNQLIQKSQTLPYTDKNIFTYHTDGSAYNVDISNPLIRFKLIPSQISDNIIQNTLKNKIHFEKRTIGNYRYSSLFVLSPSFSNTLIAEFPYFDEVYYKETHLNALLNPLFNIYTLIFIISFFTGIILSDYIVYPIRRIANELKNNSQNFSLKYISYQYNDELGELVKNYNLLIQQLNIALEQLKKEQQEKAWKLMAQQIAHDIKNTLTPVLLNAEFIKKQLQNTPQQQKILDTIIYQLRLLSRTAEDFSQFAQDISVKSENIDIVVVLNDIVLQYKNYENIQIDLSADESNIVVNTDAYLLSRIITNLINNAIESIKDTGQIRLYISKNNNCTIISISDNGCGIPKDIQEKIFEPKFSTKGSGKGLGLSIVKNLCDKLNISVSFESSENKGTIFYLKFNS